MAIEPILHDRREVVLERIAAQDAKLREDFAALEVLNYRRGFDECVALVKEVLV
jgi:hypothetical protein